MIIVGAGVAGLFAARTLLDHGVRDFRIITKGLGGRLHSSTDGRVNYGAFFVVPTYKNLRPYIRRTRRIAKCRIGFVKNGTIVSLFSLRSLVLLPQLMRVFLICFRLDRKLRSYRKRCLRMSQKQSMEADPYLLHLFHTSSKDFIVSNCLQGIADTFIDQSINAIGFDHYVKSNAFDLLKWIATIFLHRMYEFECCTETLLQGLDPYLCFDEVTKIEKNEQGSGYVVQTRTESFRAEHVIIATEAWTTRKLLGMTTQENKYSAAHVRRVIGRPKGIVAASRKKYLCFPAGSRIITITRLPDQSFLVYTQSSSDGLDEYFDDYRVIYEKTWDPAFTFRSYELVDASPSKGLYIAGDINFAGMEDCVLSGIYAAQQIVQTGTTSDAVRA